ncbi:MAG: hypothetical protein GC161_15660 [Planctomycetaceae bacterium]|nr:hypothetical protein [Planctomycetaceae bacterium]
MKHAALLLGLVLLAVGARAATVGKTAARAVLATVRVDNVVVLRASTSDDGHSDADEVWGYLERLEFAQAPEFATLQRLADLDTLELHGAESNEVGPDGTNRTVRERTVELRIAYGGTALTRQLAFTRPPGSDRWRLDPAEVKRHFDGRWITRREARLLDDPQRER